MTSRPPQAAGRWLAVALLIVATGGARVGGPGGPLGVGRADGPELALTDDPSVAATLGDGVAGIGAARAHEMGATGAGQVIAVFDSGFDLAAIDAASPGAVARPGNLSQNQPTSNAVDAACAGHGTAVAIRAAVTAPHATILPVVVRGRSDCNVNVSDDAIRWALGTPVAGLVTNPSPATVLAWSFGAFAPTASPEYLCPLVSAAIEGGAVVVASAGNDATDRANDFYPGACAGALMVGNSDAVGGRELDDTGHGSNVGTRVDLMAPAPTTSMAVPHVAGVAALVRAANPSLGAAATAALVRGFTQPFPAACIGCGTGIVSAVAAVAAARAGDPVPGRTVAFPAAATAPLGFHAVDPFRVLDTRVTGARLAAGESRRVQITGSAADVPPDGQVRAAVVNVTATASAEVGYLTAYPCGIPTPSTSSVNVAAGGTAAAAVTVQLDAVGGVCVFSSTGTDLVVDVAGYLTADPGGLAYQADQTMPRVLDTRQAHPALPDAPPIVVPVPGAVEGDAVALNVTAIGRGAAGWLAVTPCGTDVVGPVSNVNVTASGTVPNQATVRVGTAGTICVAAGDAPIDVLIDIEGRWASGPGARFVATTPTRVIDSRDALGVDRAGRVAPGTPITYGVELPAMVALAATITAAGSLGAGYFQVSPCNAARLAANGSSALNFGAGDDARANGVYAPIDPATLATCVAAGPAPGSPTAHVLLDVTGWFVAA